MTERSVRCLKSCETSCPEPIRSKWRGTGERYAPFEKSITVNKDEVQDLGVVTLKVVKGKATITLATPGAKVFMVCSDRRELAPMGHSWRGGAPVVYCIPPWTQQAQ
jgi:hypothetical protein